MIWTALANEMVEQLARRFGPNAACPTQAPAGMRRTKREGTGPDAHIYDICDLPLPMRTVRR